MGPSGNENSSSTAFRTTARNSSYVIPGMYDLTVEDSNWVLTSSFIIFTMQTGKIFKFNLVLPGNFRKNIQYRIWNA